MQIADTQTNRLGIACLERDSENTLQELYEMPAVVRTLTAGTLLVSAAPTTLRSLYAWGGTFGKIDVVDAAAAWGTATHPGTIYSLTPAAADVVSGKDINIPLAQGCVLVFATGMNVTAVHSPMKGR